MSIVEQAREIAHKAAREPLRCHFCAKTQREVKRLIASNTGAVICNECVGLCVDLLDLLSKDRA